MLKLFRFGMWAFVAIGLGIAIVGAVLTIRATQFKHSATVAQGTVVDLVEKISQGEEGTSVVYAPRVSFRTAEGQDTGFVSDTGSNPPSFHPGENVEVMYQPGHPETARINTFWQLYLAPIICLGIGTVFLVVSLFVFGVVSFLMKQSAKQQTAPPGYAYSQSAYGRQ